MEKEKTKVAKAKTKVAKAKTTKEVKKKEPIVKVEEKNYYDLTQQEIRDYEVKFKETPGGKMVNRISTTIAFFAFIILIMALIVQIYLELKNIDTGDYLGFLLPLYFIAIVVALFDIWYFSHNFTSWLKHKHHIEKW